MNELSNILVNNGGAVAMLLLLIAVITGVKQALKKYEETSVPGWLPKTAKVLRKILEYVTANDGQSDD